MPTADLEVPAAAAAQAPTLVNTPAPTSTVQSAAPVGPARSFVSGEGTKANSGNQSAIRQTASVMVVIATIATLVAASVAAVK